VLGPTGSWQAQAMFDRRRVEQLAVRGAKDSLGAIRPDVDPEEKLTSHAAALP
jgi:hypothetical protein